MRIDPLLIVTLIAGTAACAPGSESATVTTRDSAGVEIIEYPAGAVDAAPQWATGPATLTISGLGGDEETLTQAQTAQRLRDGRFVVVDLDDQAARPFLFRADGSFEGALGRAGSGPGEFQYAGVQALLPGDTILIWDGGLRRSTRLLPTGEVIGTEGLQTIRNRVLGEVVGWLGDGRLLSVPYYVVDTVVGDTKFYRRPSQVLLLDISRQALDTIATDVPGPELFVVTFGAGNVSETAPTEAPYGRKSLVIPAGERILVATNESAEVSSYSVPWQLRRVTRFARARRPVDAGAREAYIASKTAEAMAQPVRIPEQRQWLLNFVNASQFPDSMGYYGSATLGTDSTLWLAEIRSLSDSVGTQIVLGADGRLVARVTVPSDARLLWASADAVLLALRDQDDVERLELRPIIKAGE